MSHAHELHELEQAVRCVPQVDLAPASTRGELETRERVDGNGVGIDAGDVARDDGIASAENGADALAEAGKVATGDRAAHGEGDLVRPWCGHRLYDRANGEKSAFALRLGDEAVEQDV